MRATAGIAPMDLKTKFRLGLWLPVMHLTILQDVFLQQSQKMVDLRRHPLYILANLFDNRIGLVGTLID